MTQNELEFRCPFCNEYVRKEFYKSDGNVPKTLEEMKNRFGMIGMYDDK